MSVAALFVRSDSVYKKIPGVDAWDKERDARKWPGGSPLVAHPPCAQWAGLRYMAKVDQEERHLATLAVQLVRKHGGVVEHPASSTLWSHFGIPKPGEGPDPRGGWTLPVDQFWWGHEARKRTILYIVGVHWAVMPPIEFAMGEAPKTCGQSGRRSDGTRKKGRVEISKSAREHTPPAFAEWLIEVARRADNGAEDAR